MDATGSYSAAFEKVLRELEEKQKNGSYSFDAKTAYLREVVVGVCLPAIVLVKFVLHDTLTPCQIVFASKGSA